MKLGTDGVVGKGGVRLLNCEQLDVSKWLAQTGLNVRESPGKPTKKTIIFR